MKYRALWAGAVAGLAIHFLGLGWDLYRRSTDSTLASHQDVLSLTEPGHLMVVVGIAAASASLLGMAATWMQDRTFGGAGSIGALVRSASLPVIAMVAGGSIWLATPGEDDAARDVIIPNESGRLLAASSEAAEGSDGAPGTAPVTVASAPATEAAHDDDHPATSGDPSGQGNSLEHGTEVGVSLEALLAAGQFAADVQTRTAKYADVRDAMAAGYTQITQDLPGIAAHFIRSDYQRDGRELDPDYPEVLLYSKRLDGEWRLVGAMFLAESVTDTPPSHFAPLDAWHRHENLCFTAGALVSTTASASECRAGVFVPKTAYQLHVWVLPGGSGVFAHDYTPIAPGAFPPATRPAAEDFRLQAR